MKYSEKTGQGISSADISSVASLGGFGFDGAPCAVSAAGAALAYAQETQHAILPHISGLSMRSSTRSLMLDAVTLRNLEIRESIRTGTKGATLFSTLDLTRTPMGSRLLNSQLTRPLTDIGEINRRLDAVEFLAGTTTVRLALRDHLKSCADIERIAARIAYGNAGPRDLVALAETLSALPGLKHCITETAGNPLPALVSEALAAIRDMPETIDLIRNAIADDPPAVARNGGVIRTGYHPGLDGIRGVLHSGKGLDCRAPGTGEGSDRYQIPQDRVQPHLRVLHRYYETQHPARPAPVRAQADDCNRGTVHDPRTAGERGAHHECR